MVLITGGAIRVGRAISEVGAVLIVGGNIRGETRVLTTAIIQMMRMGKFDFAIALVVIFQEELRSRAASRRSSLATQSM